MLLVLQLPLADLRNFVGSSGSAVGPRWGLPPDPYRRDFLRGTGGRRATNDPRTSVLGCWPTEAWYVEARGALRLPSLTEADFPRLRGAIGQRVHPIKTLRRICSDGNALWHLQLGVELNVTAPSNLTELRAVVEDFIALPVQLHHQGAQVPMSAVQRLGTAKPLIEQRAQLAASIEASTTTRTELGAVPTGRLKAGTPLIYLETSQRCRLDDPDPSTFLPGRQVLDPDVTARGVLLQMHYRYWKYAKGDFALVWLEAGGASPARLNNLRVNLLRLHAEREVLKIVLRSANMLKEPNRALEKYLARAHTLMKLDTWFGNDQASLKAAFGAYDDLTPGEGDAILAFLDSLPKQTKARTREILTQNNFFGNVQMSGDHISVTNSSNVNIKSTLTNVQQTIGAMPAATETQKQDLQKLIESLLAELTKAPSKEAETVAKRASQLVDAAAEEKPDPSILQVIGNGLKSAAEFIKDAVPDAVKIAGQIVGLIGAIHGIPL